MSDFIKKFNADMESAIETAKRSRMDKERLHLLTTVGQDVAQMLAPAIERLAETAKMNREDLRDAMYEALGAVNSRAMNVDTAPIIAAIQEAFLNIKPPTPIVHYNAPPVNVPKIEMPKEMDINGFLDLMGVFKNSAKDPISVQLRDRTGNPVDLSGLVVSQGGGGGFRRVIIDDIRASARSLISDAEGALRVTGALSASLTLDYGSGEIGSNTPRFVMATDAVASVYVTGANGTLGATIVDSSGVGYSGSNPVPITVVSGTITMSTITSTDAVATQDLPGILGMNFGFNGASWDRIRTNTGDSAGAMRITFATDAVASVAGTVVVSSVTASIAANMVDSSGVAYSGSNPVPITLAASGGTNTINVALVDSSGVGYNGANPVPITIVSGALTSTVVVGDSAARSADNGGNPVKIGGIARTSQGTAYADGDRSNFISDKLGRQLNRPVQVRDLIITAYTSIATGTEATLLSASAGSFHDLLYVMMANSSDAAVIVDIRPVTAGNIVASVAVPANGTAGVSFHVPFPQSASDTGNNWTVDMPDITGTTVYISALFSREV